MAGIRDTAATSALNEEEYINKLYDGNLENRNQGLKEGFDSANAVLDETQGQTRQKAEGYAVRTETEAGKISDLYGDGGVTPGAQAQLQLSRENAQRKNVTDLRAAQDDADTEFQRQRQLLAGQYEAAIRKAQADNDMERAQALYQAAKEEEAQLLELQKQGALLLGQQGDMSGYDAIVQGQPLERDTAGESWGEVFRDEDMLNRIYDARLESGRAQLDGQHQQAVSDLEAQRQARERQTDEQLTQAYADALKRQKSSAEIGTAHGRASGTAAQGALAEEILLRDTLTELREEQLEADADAALQRLGLEKEHGEALDRVRYEADMERAKALFEAAENNEQVLIGNQEFAGKQAAEKGDYSILGRLYGLTEERFAPQTSAPDYVPPEDTGDEVPVTGDKHLGPVPIAVDMEGDGPGINTSVQVGSMKGSAWDYVKHNLSQLVNTGNMGKAKQYMGQVVGQMNESQYEEALSILGIK